MGFRDDREASVQRIETLERELTSTKNELEAASLRAAEVDDLRKRMVDLTKERDALKQGVEPAWAAKYRGLATGSGVGFGLLIAIAIGAGFMVVHEQRAQAARQARAEADLASCEYASEPLRQQRDAARDELRQIDEVHGDELSRMQQLLNAARMNEAGPALLVVGHVVSREGHAPEGTEDECVLAIRDLPRGYCSAAVMCGQAQVFPFDEPPPDVRCSGLGGVAWSAHAALPLAFVDARVDAHSPALLAYDAAAHTLEVRETGVGAFALHLRVTDVVTYRLR